MIGETFGALTVVARHTESGSQWLCACKCGGSAVYLTSTLTHGRRKTCGKCRSVREARGARLCCLCKQELPLADFWKRTARGLSSACKRCAAERWSTNYRKDIESSRARSRAYAKSDPRSVERQAANVSKFPAKKRAHTAVYRAVKRGELVRPPGCSCCGDGNRVEAHHDDYAKPLDVLWLCTSCHRARHAELRAAGMDPEETARSAA
jgi:hypothetical protein